MHDNDSWRRPRGHGVIHSTTAGSWAEWLELSPSQRSFSGDTLMFSEQMSWLYEALKTKILRCEIKLQYEHVRVVQKSELKNQKLEFYLEVEQEVGSEIWFTWTTFELHSGNALPYLYPIFYSVSYSFISYIYSIASIVYAILYIQYSVTYILYPIFYSVSYSFISYI